NSSEAEKVADEIIKNTYRTLMTRGMKGCYVYCEDQELRDYLRERIQK
ncbi:MAG: DNA/RNA helicase domain-containing protein, partial [Lachnospiraceae bacterium]